MENDREWGYRKLVVWKNAYELRKLIYEISSRFPKLETRRVSQMRDAARSIKQNIQEGYKLASLKEYMRCLNIARGSLGELRGDIEDCFDDGLISDEEFKKLDSLAGKTDYLFERLLTSLKKKDLEGSWKKFP